MALPGSPPIGLSQVCSEFGAPANTSLSAFLRGGSWVPNIPANSNVPTTLPIKLTDLLGAMNTSPISASASPSSLAGSGAVNTTVYSNSTTVTVTGGSGTISYLWQRLSGTGTATNPTSATTTFSDSRASAGSQTSTWRCKVTRGGEVAYTSTVSVSLDWIAMTASLYPASVGDSGMVNTTRTTGICTASYSGGSGAVSYQWQRVSGDTTISANSATSATTTFTGTTMSTPGTRSGVWCCKVTRGGEVAYTNNVTITLTWTATAPLTASLSPTSLYGLTTTNGGTATTTGSCTASYSGGSGSVSYQWERVSGDSGVSIISPTSATTKFSAVVGSGTTPRSAVFRCKVTRGLDTVYTSNNVSVTLEYSP